LPLSAGAASSHGDPNLKPLTEQFLGRIAQARRPCGRIHADYEAANIVDMRADNMLGLSRGELGAYPGRKFPSLGRLCSEPRNVA